MKTFKRICIKDYSVTDGKETFELKRGKEYLTSCEKDGHVTVLDKFWVSIPVNIFAGEVPGPGTPHNLKLTQTIKIKSITVVNGSGSDTILLHADLPNPIYPFNGDCVMRIDCAPTKTKEFLETNFPNIIPDFVTERLLNEML